VDSVESILNEFDAKGVETTLTVRGKTYRVFAYESPGRSGPRVRWNLYEVEKGSRVRGVTFGIASGAREAMEDLVRAAESHARGAEPVRPAARTFRPGPQD
jgi:hypothetical protein